MKILTSKMLVFVPYTLLKIVLSGSQSI
ncbi:hypothetical protein TSAR_009034 [Trichomalopsis sarcophagae]|uniref:Uncharacterized protein n=1 Tax=Trichomalopsis sarcophagae TaxID=543379 RepID=A0A232ESG8_9HYME|nr:hypothetical protein TSAR_009034 [Trichomalopsis sarcophagae]